LWLSDINQEVLRSLEAGRKGLKHDFAILRVNPQRSEVVIGLEDLTREVAICLEEMRGGVSSMTMICSWLISLDDL
jgi:hypothetical protein